MRRSWSGLLVGVVGVSLWATPALAWETNVCIPEKHGGYRLVVPRSHEEWEKALRNRGTYEVEKGKPCRTKEHPPKPGPTATTAPSATVPTPPPTATVPAPLAVVPAVVVSTPPSGTPPSTPSAPSASTSPPPPQAPPPSPVLSSLSVPAPAPQTQTREERPPDRTPILICVLRPGGPLTLMIQRDGTRNHLSEWHPAMKDARGYTKEGPCPTATTTPRVIATGTAIPASLPTAIPTASTTLTPSGSADIPTPDTAPLAEEETHIDTPLCIRMLETGEVVDCSYEDEAPESDAPAYAPVGQPAPVEDFEVRPEKSGPGRG